MSIKLAIPFLLLPLVSASALAQQTGTMVGTTPGSAVNRGLRVVREVPPPPTCAPAGGVPAAAGNAPALPDLVFARMELLCVRHSDGRFEELPKDIGGLLSPDGQVFAYWNKEKHELHFRSMANGSDTVADVLPDFTPREMFWSEKGRAFVYPANNANPLRYRVLDLETGKRSLVGRDLTRIVGVPDPAHLLATTQNTVERISVADGKHEVLATLNFPNTAQYSPGGAWLAIQVQLDAQKPASDDEPDCSSGIYAIVLQKTATRQLLKVPFPDGFESVVDFAFSPDDRALAVTFGGERCDYPGDKARVYVVSLPDLALTPLSPAGRLSVEPHWSPDGKAIVYSDFSAINPPLIAVDLRTGKATNLTNPGQYRNATEVFLSWRQP
jgi:dipeptidyl aminopeptidase/acylaminoacyl peptidase